MLIHFRDSMEQLAEVQRNIARTEFGSFLQPTHSYVSIVELGLYESSVKTYSALDAQNVEPFGDEWDRQIQEMIDRQSTAMVLAPFPLHPRNEVRLFLPDG